MSENEIQQDTKSDAAQAMASDVNEGLIESPSWQAWADQPAHIQGAIALCFLGLVAIAGYFGFRQEPVRCGMPALINEFNQLLAANIKKANDENVALGRPPLYDKVEKRRIRATANVTIGKEANFLLCVLVWEMGDPSLPDGQIRYYIGRDDAGALMWELQEGLPPYLPAW